MTTMTRTLPAAVVGLGLLFAMGPSYRPHPLKAHNSDACAEADDADGRHGIVVAGESAEDAATCLTIETGDGRRVVIRIPEEAFWGCLTDPEYTILWPDCAAGTVSAE